MRCFSLRPSGKRRVFYDATMRIAEMFLAEIDRETPGTIKALERVPKDKLEWRPHPKSRTLLEQAHHVAQLPAFGALGLRTGTREMGGKPSAPASPDFVATFNKAVEDFKAAVSQVSDEQLLNETFSFTMNDKPVRTFSKADFL